MDIVHGGILGDSCPVRAIVPGAVVLTPYPTIPLVYSAYGTMQKGGWREYSNAGKMCSILLRLCKGISYLKIHIVLTYFCSENWE